MYNRELLLTINQETKKKTSKSTVKMNHETGAGENPDLNSGTNSFGEAWGKMDQQPQMYGRTANIGLRYTQRFYILYKLIIC